MHVFALSVWAKAVGWCGSWAAETSGLVAVGSWGREVVRSCGRGVVGSWGRGVVEMFNGVLDFDGVVRDPARDERRRAGYDSGGQLHPGDAGLAALAESVDLTLL